MKTLITYATTHGCTEKAANELKKKIGGDTSIVNLKEEHNPSISEFDRVIIGGSIHAGTIQKRVTEFTNSNLEELKQKEIGLFICCMFDGGAGQEQLKKAFPEELHQVAKREAVFGGAFDFEKMKFFEKMIVKKVAKVKESVSKVDHEEIYSFAFKMNKVFNPFLFLS